MKRIAISMLLFVLLPGCAPSAQAVQTAMAQTQAAAPTATVIPLSALSLESMLITAGDLPAGYAAAQVRSTRSDFTKYAPDPDYFIGQTFSHNGQIGGLVEVLVYEDVSKVPAVFDRAAGDMPGDVEDIDVGERGKAASSFLIVETASLSFMRCHAVIALQFMGSSNINDAISYAKRLDARLQPIVCR